MLDLKLMDSAARQACYEDIFANKTERLHTLAFPSELTDEHPHLTEEINAAYLRHTIFNVEVWMNYDPAAQRFFNDEGRAQDCGKLRLPVPRKKKRKRDGGGENEVQGVRQRLQGLEFGRVRLEVHTPFTRLGSILVEVVPPSASSGTDVRLKVKRGFRNRDELFAKGLHYVFTAIKEDFVPAGRAGLSLGDLDALAENFRVDPRPEDLTWAGWVRDTQTWMNFLRPEERNREGFVEGLD